MVHYIKVNGFGGAALIASQGKPLVAKGYGEANVEWQSRIRATTPGEKYACGLQCRDTLTWGVTRMADQKLNEALLTAAEKGDTGKVRALLAKGADVNARDSAGATPLILALKTSGHTEAVHTLLHAGADVNVPGAGGFPPLILAILHADLYTVQALLAKGADIEAKGEFMTPLMQAVTSRTSTVPALLAHGADVNAKDMSGKTVLMWAVDTSFAHAPGSEMVPSLLDKGAEANAKDSDGLTALLVASMASDKNRFNPPVIEALLSKGADVNARDRRGQTALMKVVATIAQQGTLPGHPSLAFAKVLIAHGADVNAKDNAGESVLMKAGRSDSLIARTLKRAGATKSPRSRTPVE